MGKFIDLTGMKFGKLTVVERLANRIDSNGVYCAYWKCICDCGNIVKVKGNSLKSGNTKSCGCYCKERIRESHKKYNDYEIQEDYVIMYTSKGEPFYVDLEDFWRVKDICWSKDKDGYLVGSNNGKGVKLHRLIMDCPDDMVVDHIRGEKSRNDNRKENLRIGTKGQNRRNTKRTIRNKSGVVGVFWNKEKNKWVAQITINHKIIRLGYFINFEDAVKARKEAEKKYFGEWSYDNSQRL